MATDTFFSDLDELCDKVVDEENLELDGGDLADTLDNVSRLQKTRRYIDIMQKVKDALIEKDDYSNYDQLILDCNALSIDIENEVFIIHNFIRDKYRPKFPELECLVPRPIDYARVVKKIGNQMDPTLVDLKGTVEAERSSNIIMTISLTASTTSGKPLPEDVLHETLEACDRALALDSAKKKLVDFLETRMRYIAPNLSAIVGSAVAAKLIGAAAGLSSLANMPSCNVLSLGSKSKNLAGFSSQFCRGCGSYVEQTEIFQNTPPPLRKEACGWLADKSTLAARVDSNSTRGSKGETTGEYGTYLKEEILRKIEKSQKPPLPKQQKPLSVPDVEHKNNKRGGQRLRKRKQRYEITDKRKLVNRMQFGVAEESSLGDGLGVGYGMLGQAGSGKLRVSAKVAKKKFTRSSGAVSGLTSNLAFTPVQGIELLNPANQLIVASGTQSTYFSETKTFSKVITNKYSQINIV
nr:U4/U6 small nuclear ribonucleoprotein Prp31 homolog [Nicotiana tomentosiformis]